MNINQNPLAQVDRGAQAHSSKVSAENPPKEPRLYMVGRWKGPQSSCIPSLYKQRAIGFVFPLLLILFPLEQEQWQTRPQESIQQTLIQQIHLNLHESCFLLPLRILPAIP